MFPVASSSTYVGQRDRDDSIFCPRGILSTMISFTSFLSLGFTYIIMTSSSLSLRFILLITALEALGCGVLFVCVFHDHDNHSNSD